MTASNRIVLSSDHAAIPLRQFLPRILLHAAGGRRYRADDAGEHALSSAR